MKQKKFSLSTKINLLMITIILVISVALISICSYVFKKVALSQVYDILDDVDNESVDSMEMLYHEMDIINALEHYDSYEKVRAEAEEKNDSTVLDAWIVGYLINAETKEIISEEEYSDRKKKAANEAKKYIDNEDEIYTWVDEHYPDLYGFYYGPTLFNSVALFLNNLADKVSVSSISIYTEEDNGYSLVIKSDSSATGDTFTKNTPTFGKHFDQVQEIDSFKNPNNKDKQKYPIIYTDDGPVISRVTQVNYSDNMYYIVYSYNISKILAGQTRFLISIIIMVLILMVIATIISLLVMKKIVTKPLKLLTKSVKEFHLAEEDGDNTSVIDLPINSNDEIGELYDNIKSMETRIIDDSTHITNMTAEKERMSTELKLATRIQADMLPQSFPAFPDRSEFDIYASMDPAKEVGGDFYDFFLVDEDHLALIIADVSGKGIPAALFMMISKIIMQNSTLEGLSPANILERANRQIAANNLEEMFVTTWIGILEISTGKLIAANAGHEYPAIMHPNGAFELLKDQHGFVLGIIDGIKYNEYELQIEPGSKLFVYTDGVPEATNSEDELFGTTRMIDALNQIQDGTPEEILQHIREQVDVFVGKAEQFDDLTMLCIEYRGPER